MTRESLEKIKEAFDVLELGISKPLLVQEAYELLPMKIADAPMMSKIRAINRFMMFDYALQLSVVEMEEVTVDDDEIYNEDDDNGQDDDETPVTVNPINDDETTIIPNDLLTSDEKELINQPARTELIVNKEVKKNKFQEYKGNNKRH